MLIDVVIKALEDEYAIRSVCCQETHGIMIKHNYIITDENNENWFIKYYPSTFGESNLERLGHIYYWLEQGGFPTCNVKENLKTGKFYMRTDTGFYVVYSFIDAKVADSHSVIKIMDGIQKFHEISDSSFIKMLNRTSDRILFAQSIYAEISKPQYQLFKDYLGNRVDLIRRLLEMPPWPCNKVIHGDLNLGNVLNKDDKIYFIDLDEMRLGDPLEDLVSLIYSLLYRKGILDFQCADDVRNLMAHFFHGELTIENMEQTEFVLKMNSIYYLMQRANCYQYLKRHKSTLNFMDSLLKILDNNVVITLCGK